jgi:sialate O-acetylesterase
MKTKLLSLGILLLAANPAGANVKLPTIFSDHMVLQATEAVPVWGWAEAGEEVRVTFHGQTYTAKANAEGCWLVRMNLKATGAGPFEMEVAGKNRITLHDVVVGQVWLASGQSNMEFMLKQAALAKEEIAASANPMIRHFKVARAKADVPARDCEGQWVVASPATSGDFTAVGYFFAKRLQREIGGPIGLIHSSWGGTPSEAWTSTEAVATLPSLAAAQTAGKQARREYPARIKAFAADFAAWIRSTGREDKPADAAPFLAETAEGWTPVTLPGKISAPGLPEYGAVWLRREVDVPAAAIAQGLNVLLGDVKGFESVFWNGKKISETTLEKVTGEGMPRLCHVTAALIKPGKNILTLRVFSPAATLAVHNNARAFNAGPVSLAGTWHAKAEFTLPPLTALPAPPKPPALLAATVASDLFNGMIAPLVPFQLAGVIWYQGEANRGRAWEYREAFPLLIKDWRKQWGRDGLPFYYCQLANYLEKSNAPSESAWAETREAQALALALPATGQAVLIDIGEAKDIHPINKQDAGDRLARIALANNYGKDIPYSGPLYATMKVEGKTMRVTFRHTDGGLVARPLPARCAVHTSSGLTAPLVRNSPDSELEGFAICGADRQWVWAKARIDGNAVVVWSDKVTQPSALRYAWADNPTCNLFNGAGLPASPFRTDAFPVSTQGNASAPRR